MKVENTQFNNRIRTENIMKERHKSDFQKNNENKSIQINRPADQLGFSGSEHSYQKNISFKGNPKLAQEIATSVLTKTTAEAADKLPKWAEKMGGSNWFDKVLKVVHKNEAGFDAFIALVVAGILKPVCVLAMPGAEREDKEMSATKNAVSAFIGFVLSNLILGPCSNAVNRITKSFDSTNPTQYIKNQEYINAITSETIKEGAKSTLDDAFKTAYKRFPDLGVSPLKAGVTIALTPLVLNVLFKKDEKKKAKKMKPMENPINQMAVMNAIRMDEVNKNKNKEEFLSNSNTNTSSQPAFKGNAAKGVSETIEVTQEIIKKKNILSRAKDLYTDTLGEPIAKFYGKLANTKPAQWLVEKTSHFEKPSARWSDLASVAITFFYVNNTWKSEKMEPERKLPLMINNIMVTAASSTAAFLIDKYTDKPMEELLKSYITKHETTLHDNSNKHIKKVLQNVYECSDKELNALNIKKLMKHGEEIIGANGEKLKDMSGHLKKAIEVLMNDDVIKQAIKDKLISAEDVQKMAAAGFAQQASKIYKNISKAKSLTVFTFTVRFLVTVLMTPVIGRVVALVNKKLGKEEAKPENKKDDKTIPPACSETIGMKDYMNSLNK